MIVPQITYKVSIWHTATREKGSQKTLVMQLPQAKALRASFITGVFKSTLAQALNMKVYLIFIGFELDKKVDQKAACLCFRPLYHMLS